MARLDFVESDLIGFRHRRKLGIIAGPCLAEQEGDYRELAVPLATWSFLGVHGLHQLPIETKMHHLRRAFGSPDLEARQKITVGFLGKPWRYQQVKTCRSIRSVCGF
jgi:hypothetical protein